MIRPRVPRIRRLGLICASAVVFPLTATVWAQPRAGSLARLDELSDAFVAVAGTVSPGVVFVEATKEVGGGLLVDPLMRRFLEGTPMERMLGSGEPREEQVQGSGVILTPDGLVVTNDHNIRGADSVWVTLNDRRRLAASIVGRDPTTDLALLKVEAQGLPTVPMGDSESLRVGEWVVAIGNPFGLASTVTAGIVSAKGRANVGVSMYEDFIQTDAAINPGNSGGALVNTRGQLVGINSAILSQGGGSLGIGFAIPGRIVQSVVAELQAHGKVSRAWLGVIPAPVPREWAERLGLQPGQGVVAARLYRRAPAIAAGMRPGDVILSVDGEGVSSAWGARQVIVAKRVGDEVHVVVRRGEESVGVDVRSVEQPVDERTGLPLPGL
jgi:Do/DeqQ family serine protease